MNQKERKEAENKWIDIPSPMGKFLLKIQIKGN